MSQDRTGNPVLHHFAEEERMPKKSKKSKQRRHQMRKSRKGQAGRQRTKGSDSPSLGSGTRDDVNRPEVAFINVSRDDVPLVDGGYRIVGPAQAMADYAKPLLDAADDEDIETAFTLAQILWNLAILRDKDPEQFQERKAELAGHADMPESEDIVNMMIERFVLMFPYIGREASFYMRERVVDIEEYEPFDESTLHIREDAIPATKKEMRLAKALRSIDPDEDEFKLAEWRDDVLDCYVDWCFAKGVPDDRAVDFAYIVSSYLDFLSNYHGETVSADTPVEIVQEFMRTFFIRKTAMPSQEKSMMPCALKLFMQYLEEKSIVSGTGRVRQRIESEQDTFQENLRLWTDPTLGGKIILL
jgi:hypothetical protein